MTKKIVLGIAVAGTTLALLPLFAAFEAHVVNVTAKIENALSVDTTPIDFGTVFPQEQLDRTIAISLSQSFQDEDNANDVEYFLRQKPKCAWTVPTTDGGTLILGQTQSGHVTDAGEITCPEPGEAPVVPTDNPNIVPASQPSWGPLPLLCRYLSKHDLDPEDENDQHGIDAFHEIGAVVGDAWVWNDIHGILEKDASTTDETVEDDYDLRDVWNLDLKVPCFGGQCAQDWADFVTGINPNANPDNYVQNTANEHDVFGCDLWIEVEGVSRFEN